MSSCTNLTACSQKGDNREEQEGKKRDKTRRGMTKPFPVVVGPRMDLEPSPLILSPHAPFSSGLKKTGPRLCGREGLPGNVFTETRAWPRGVAELSKATCTLEPGAGAAEGPGREEGPGLPLVPRNQSSQPWAFSSPHTEALLLER